MVRVVEERWKTSSGNDILYLDVIQQCKGILEYRDRSGFRTRILHVKGHCSSYGNNSADLLARNGATMSKVQAMSDTIFFASGTLSQFHPSPFIVQDEGDDHEFNCAEQWYQYMKALTFDDLVTAKKIYASENPMWQKSLGQNVSGFKQDVWSLRGHSHTGKYIQILSES